MFVSALQSQLRAGTATFTMAGTGGLRQVAVTQIAAGGSVTSRPAQIIQQQGGQTLMRTHQAQPTGLIVSHHGQQQPSPRQQTLTLQRPQQVGLISGRPGGGIRQQVLVTGTPQSIIGGSPGTTTTLVRASPQQQQQLVLATTAAQGGMTIGSPRQRPNTTTQVVVVSTAATATATRQHYVISTSQGGGVGQAQLLTLTGGGGHQTVRPGQIVQVAGPSGQQHQIVVSQSGQIVLQSPATIATTKQL